MSDNPKNNKTAIYIRSARVKLGMTQQEFGDRLNVPRYNIAKYESGKTIPPGDVILHVAELVKLRS